MARRDCCRCDEVRNETKLRGGEKRFTRQWYRTRVAQSSDGVGLTLPRLILADNEGRVRGSAFCFFLCLPLAAQQASIEGIASDAISHAPLTGVHVRLSISRPDSTPIAYGAMSDGTGHFSIATIAPGTYDLKAEHAGFVYHGPKAITLRSGQSLTDFKLELTPEAAVSTVISGRLSDGNGDPVSGVMIGVVSAKGSVTATLVSGFTDDRGEFRLSAPPGKYYVKASIPGPGDNEPLDIRGDCAPVPISVDTWFPDAVSADQATEVDASAGREAGGIDIHLAQQRTLIISGLVNGVPASVEAVVDAEGTRTAVRSANVGADGKFKFAGLIPDTYRLSAMSSGEKSRLRSRKLEVTLDADVTNLEFTLQSGEELSGTLEMQGDRTMSTVTLEPQGASDFAADTPDPASVDKNGAFRVGNVFPGHYEVEVNPLPGDSYIKEVRLNGAIVDGVLDLSAGAGGSKLKVTVSPDGAELSGIVRPPGTQTSVFLVSDPNRIGPRNMTGVAPDGTWSISGIRPGKYRLFSVEWSAHEGFGALKDTADKAQEIELKAGDRIRKDLKRGGAGAK
jgi:Carboxypeptidase regulatory-like domain